MARSMTVCIHAACRDPPASDGRDGFHGQRLEMTGERVVEQRARPACPQPLHDVLAAHAQLVQDTAGQERRTVVPHAAVGEHAVTVPDEMRAHGRDGVEPRGVRQLLIEDREVHIEAFAGSRGNALVEAAFEVDHHVDAVRGDVGPVLDDRGNEEPALVINLEECHGFAGLYAASQRPMSFSARMPERMPPRQRPRLRAAADRKDATTAACRPIGIGSCMTRYASSVDEGQPTSAIRTIVNNTATIMNATPPYEPAT